jgi:two-component system, NtrC family, response regulator AtoC
VPSLVSHFLARFSARYGRPGPALGPELRGLLERHPFPGNIRELENMMKRIVVLGSDESIVQELENRERHGRRTAVSLEDILAEVEETAGDVPLREVGRRASLEAERAAIEDVLLRTNWNRKRAARMLNVSYKTLLLKIRECGLAPE